MSITNTITSSSSSSILLSSLNRKAPSFSCKPHSLSLPSTTCSPHRLFLQHQQLKQPQLLLFCSPSRFVRKVAVSSEFGQEDALSEEEEEAAASFSPDLKLFVGNLPFSVDSAQLAALFENAGNVEMVEVIYDKVTGRSRGFGFVTMSSVEEVQAATEQFNGYELNGRALRVNSGPPPQRENSFSRGPSSGGGGGGGGAVDAGNRLYVGNLSWAVDNLALENLFSEQGKVVEARVVYDRDTGRSRGFGFVTYSSADEVDNAIESLNGVDLDGRPIRVSVAEARPRRQF